MVSTCSTGRNSKLHPIPRTLVLQPLGALILSVAYAPIVAAL